LRIAMDAASNNSVAAPPTMSGHSIDPEIAGRQCETPRPVGARCSTNRPNI
jgi:hypothetical protein